MLLSFQCLMKCGDTAKPSLFSGATAPCCPAWQGKTRNTPRLRASLSTCAYSGCNLSVWKAMIQSEPGGQLCYILVPLLQ
jgi:hypothetical protein